MEHQARRVAGTMLFEVVMRRASQVVFFVLMGCSASSSETGGSGDQGNGGDAGSGDSIAPGAGGGGGTSMTPNGGQGGTMGTSGSPSLGGASGSSAGKAGASGAAGASNGGAGTGGTGGSTATGGSDAGALGYNPCPAKGTPCAIMPLGDSITAGAYSSNQSSYRGPLFIMARAHAQTITFVGTQVTGPDMLDGVPFPKHNEGHGGYVIDTTPGGQYPGISGLTPDSIKANHPHIVTLMIGTNDVNIQYDLAHASTRLGNLVDSILAADPNLLLVVAQITPSLNDDQNMRIQTYNSGVADVVKARADAGKHITMVDMYGAFTANPNYKTEYMGDNLHPIDAGHAKMADVWYARIGSLLR